MSTEERRTGGSENPQGEERASGSRDETELKNRGSKQEFAWYGGKVDREIVREIVRLKREHKL